ncbi:MAG TPA: lipopolysaccharide biosynthesis protein [Burkholderiales bacterium]|nr:lipopolysaccharide biosynthesis protein [Burkholderiales bacterium]
MNPLKSPAVLQSIAHTVYALCQLYALTVLARLGGVSAVGSYALALAVVTPTWMFVGLGMRQLVAVDVSERFGLWEYFLVRLMTGVGGVVICGIFGWLMSDASGALLAVAMGVARFIEALGDLVSGVYIRAGGFTRGSLSQIARNILGVAGLSLGYGLSESLVVAVLVQACCLLAVFVTIDLTWLRKKGDCQAAVQPRGIFWKRSKELFWISLPLGFSAMLGSINSYVPQYLTEFRFGTDYLAILVSAFYFLRTGTIVVISVWQVSAPAIARNYKREQWANVLRQLWFAILIAVLLGNTVALIGWFAGGEILSFLLGDAFGQNIEFIRAIALVAIPLYIAAILNGALVPLERTKQQLAIWIIAVGVNLLIGFVAMLAIGIVGIAVGWAASLLAQILWSSLVIRRVLRRG